MAPAVTRSRGAAAAVVREVEQVERNGHKFNTKAPVPRQDADDYDILRGDHGLKPQKNLDDFIWTDSPEPHAGRKREMMKELGKKVQELQGHEPLSKFLVTPLVCLQIYIGYLMREEALGGGSLLFWVTAYVVGATLAQNLFLANHEVSHNLFFKTVTANKLYGIFANMPMLVPYFIAFKEYHQEHHKFQGSDGIDTDLPTELEARLLSSVPGKLFYMFNQTWFYAFRPVFIKPKPFTPWHGLNVLVQVSFIYTVVKLWGMGPIWYFLASAHFAGSWHPMASHFIAEHYTFAGEAETASYYGWMNMLTWNVGFHNEHHDFPNVPWTRLPKLRDVGAKWYDTVPYHKSWVGALWTFIFDPEISMYNRVKRETKDK